MDINRALQLFAVVTVLFALILLTGCRRKSSSKSSAPGGNVPPTVAITAPTSGTHAGNVQITYDLRDVDSDDADIVVEYSTDGGGTWNPAAMGSGSEGTAGLATNPAGVSHTYVWDMVTDDVGTSSAQSVELRITPSDKDGAGTADTTSFTVGNAPPTVAITAPTSGTHAGNVQITYDLRDVDSDDADIVVEYSTDGGGTWNPAAMGSGSEGTAGLATSPAGVSHTYVWDTVTDDVGTSSAQSVELRITPGDKDGAGTADTTSFTVGNAFALDMTWAVQSASAAELQWMANRIKVLNQYIWYATEGQMYLRNQTLKVGPGTFPDSVIIDRVFGAGGGYSQGTCTFNGAWVYVHIQHGDGCAQVWLHEFGHAAVRYNLSEEYDCRACAMGAYVGGSGEGIYQYCDTSNCNTGFRCWDGRIRQVHPDWTHPGPGGACPPCNVTIQ